MDQSPKEPVMAGVALVAATAEVELAFSLPPGFRFHPTDQELVNCFLRRKVLGHGGLHLDFIPEVDLYRFEPYELPEKSFSPSTCDPEAKVEWYLFAPRGRKYPTGLRMERATQNGFWKSTGKDRYVMHNGTVVGMKKTLVFHIGRTPSGTRTDWVMHEYRLHGHRHVHDTYALCRVFNKNVMTPLSNVSGVVNMDKEGIQSMSGGVNSDMGGIHPMSVGANAGKEGFPSLFVVPNTDKDEMQPMSGGIDVDKEGMHSVPNDADMDKEGIHHESDGANADKEGIQPVLQNANADKERIHPMSGSIISDMEGIHPVPGSVAANMEGIHPMSGGTVTDKKEIHPVSGGADVDEDFSWMQFVPDHICYPSIELDMDDSCMQLINDYLW